MKKALKEKIYPYIEIALILILLLIPVILMLNQASAFQLEKSLVQVEQDQNYPCYVEGSDTIVCPQIDNQKVQDWVKSIVGMVILNSMCYG